jgi:hypothetical protein
MKSTGKADSNDPYLVCDCARQYLTGRVTPLYEDVVSRVGRYVSVTSTPATSSLYGSSLNLLIDVAGRPPTTATRVISACHELLFLEERSRANSEYVHGSDPGFNPVSLETFRNSVYGQLGLELRDLWQAHIDEIFLGIFELTNIQSNREYVAWARLKVEIALNPNGDFRPYCSEADNTAQDSVNWLGREMPGVLAAMEVTRRQLERDLRFWQDFAARDGWPRQHSYVPFGEMADRLWKSAHLHGWTGPEADSVVVKVWTQRPTGGGGCDDWKVQPPGSAVLVTGTVNGGDVSLPLFKDVPVTATTFFSGVDVSQSL